MAKRLPTRQSIRWKGFDYSKGHAYFFTICTQQRACILGQIVNGKVVLSSIGRIVEDQWHELPRRFDFVELDWFVVMPNHVHGVLLLAASAGPAVYDDSSRTLDGDGAARKIATDFGAVVGALKSLTTVAANRLAGRPGRKLWHWRCHDRVVRNERELGEIRRYIQENPLKWTVDRENPGAVDAERSEPWKTHVEGEEAGAT